MLIFQLGRVRQLRRSFAGHSPLGFYATETAEAGRSGSHPRGRNRTSVRWLSLPLLSTFRGRAMNITDSAYISVPTHNGGGSECVGARVSRYYDHLEPYCFKLTQTIHRWLTENGEPAPQAAYFADVSERYRKSYEAHFDTSHSAPAATPEEIRPSVEYISLIHAHVTDVLSGR